MKAEIVVPKEELFKELSKRVTQSVRVKDANVTFRAIANDTEVDFTAIKFIVEGEPL